MAGGLNTSTLPAAVIGFAVLGAIYMWHAVRTADDDALLASHVLGFLGGLLPLGLAVVLAADSRFVEQWPWVLGNLVILGVAVIAHRRAAAAPARPALGRRHRVGVPGVGVAPWHGDRRRSAGDGGPAADRDLQRARPAVARPAGERRQPPDAVAPRRRRPDRRRRAGPVLAEPAGPDHPAARASSSASSRCCSWSPSSAARSRSRPMVLPATAAVTGVLAQVWFEHAALPGQYVGLLAFAHVLAVAYAVVAVVRDRLGVDDDAPWVLRADMAVLVAAVVAYLGLHGALARSEFAAPTPLFALLGLDVALVLLVAIRRAWTSLVPLAALAAVLFAGSWHALHFSARDRHGRGRRRDRDLPAVRGAAVHHGRGPARRVAPRRRRLADLGADRTGVVPAVPRRLARLLGPGRDRPPRGDPRRGQRRLARRRLAASSAPTRPRAIPRRRRAG